MKAFIKISPTPGLTMSLLVVFCLFFMNATVLGERTTSDMKGGNLECPPNCEKWYITLDDYGYSDWLMYTPTGVPQHEMMSGEWAAAIYYSGIPTAGSKSMWLTPQFICPNWTTNSNFNVVNGLVGGGSVGTSTISNAQVRIKIDYQLLCGQVAMGLKPGMIPPYIPSDTCFMIVTYTITNLSLSETLDSVYFYQFLHGHPADEYGNVVLGQYDSIIDPVLMYQSFFYDITMWAPSHWGEFVEYIGFHAERKPSDFDVWTYPDHSGRPPTGLHNRVENRSLQNDDDHGPDQVAGAMEWNLGTIPPEGSDSVTVILSVATGPIARKVPSLTGWGILVLVLLLIVATIIVVRQKRKAALN
jgi:hypothetical protein